MRENKPIHNQISDILRQRIAAGQYEETGLPPELTLVEEFGVSRHTIRSAMQRLVVDGLIERRAGLGTRVTRRAAGSSWLIGSLDEIVEYSIDRIRTIQAGLIPAREAPHVAALFGTPPAGKVFRLVRAIATETGLVSCIANIYTSAAIASRIPRQVIDQPLFLNHIQKYCAVRTDRVRQVASAMAAQKELATQLECRTGEPILLLQRTYTSSDNDPIMFVELFCRPDRYQQTVNFIQERTDAAAVPADGTGAAAPAPAQAPTAHRAAPRRRAKA
jgi:GntR family transcriptional regulator